MFVNNGGDLSVTFAEVNNSDNPVRQFVVESKGAQKKEIGNPDAGFRGFRAIFYEGRLAK
jgi:hypothetical protein